MPRNSQDKGHYLGNPNLKASGVKMNYTKEQVREIIKCKKDPLYFIKNYFKIVHVDKGLIQFEPFKFQQKMINAFHNNRFVITKCPRQSGKTTAIIAYLCHYVLFNKNINIAILANKGQTSNEILGRIQLAYQHLPKWLQQGVTVWNKGSLELENGSQILANSTSSDSIRGHVYNIIFLDEFAFVKYNIADEFFRSTYPTITSGKTTKCFIVSTPKGMNMFYRLWTDSVEGNNDFVHIDVDWRDVPGRDEEFKKETIKNIGEDGWREEFECSFLGSKHTLISPTKLRTMTFKKPIFSREGLDIYEAPQKGHYYAITVDVSEGIDEDYQAFTVLDITDFPYRLVAKYRKRDMPVLLYPNVIYKTAKDYNNACVLVERNNNGTEVGNSLYYDLEYEYLLMVTIKGRKGQTITEGFGKQGSKTHLGLHKTKEIKRLGCSLLKSLIEEDKLIIEDFDIINELTSFAKIKNSYEAEPGLNDDLVDCLISFAWLTCQDYFKNLTNSNLRELMYKKRMEEIEQTLTPFGFIDEGVEEIIGINNPETDSNGDVWFPVKTWNHNDFF